MSRRVGQKVGQSPLGGDVSATRTTGCQSVVNLVFGGKTRCKPLQTKNLCAESWIPKLDVGGSNPLARFHKVFFHNSLQVPIRCKVTAFASLLASESAQPPICSQRKPALGYENAGPARRDRRQCLAKLEVGYCPRHKPHAWRWQCAEWVAGVGRDLQMVAAQSSPSTSKIPQTQSTALSTLTASVRV